MIKIQLIYGCLVNKDFIECWSGNCESTIENTEFALVLLGNSVPFIWVLKFNLLLSHNFLAQNLPQISVIIVIVHFERFKLGLVDIY